MKVRDLLTLRVEDLALGGKALARHEGCVVFVDRGLPGDRITARVSKKQRSFAEAKLVSVDEPSADRIAARCAHEAVCGGCRLQELPYEQQVAVKERQVRETLQHLAGIANPKVNPIVHAPEPWHYRNKMEFSFMRAPDGSAVLGMHERGTWDKVFELRECWLTSPLVVEITRLTQRFARERRWEPYHPTQHVGVVRFLTVRHLVTTGECAVHLIAASDQMDGLSEWADAVMALSPEVKSVTLGLNTAHSNVAFMEEEIVLRGSDAIVERLLGLEFEVVGSAFLQTNSAQAEHLYQGALDAAQLTGDETVLDLYCGAGTMTLLFARAAKRAVGVETVSDAIDRARRNAQRNGLGETQFECGEARMILREWAQGKRADAPKPDLIVVDPPRAGLHPRVVFRCAELAPKRIVYVSCNPATLARDLKDFAAYGYELAEVTPYDMFPHTPHIECVARIERTAGAKA
ncbi:MAG: 23S rRNA (uracil(1939)-C(5))-methyltransferase RlmD [Candidatus Eisenbacteria bacterium]|uniref:23S rRNA (Uracil(1939)-C(5))-methyltransferase RlmD n=1 Tax=Eiseniibacteriota bacterium TaxID=2212470 RepID=A0A933WA89_UNCEI|nr:23S rRNA (uracil(1939)-C(5))-methyltransferase RlmD [Candidatus Eisenbacteria bacterium]